MTRRLHSYLLRFGILTFLSTIAATAQPATPSSQLAPGTAVPIIFAHTVSASKQRTGDPVIAKTMEAIVLGNGEIIPKGSSVIGHVVQATSLQGEDSTSVLAIHFDQIAGRHFTIPVTLSVRAMANVSTSEDAMYPMLPRDMNISGEQELIGGDMVEPLDRHVHNFDGDTVGENKKDGIYERLQPASFSDRYSNGACQPTTTEQPVGIYSSSACGLYGFSDTYLTHSGTEAPFGVFEIQARHHTITLYGRTTALLQVANGSFQ